jgi:hypothetical protein
MYPDPAQDQTMYSPTKTMKKTDASKLTRLHIAQSHFESMKNKNGAVALRQPQKQKKQAGQPEKGCPVAAFIV